MSSPFFIFFSDPEKYLKKCRENISQIFTPASVPAGNGGGFLRSGGLPGRQFGLI
jgi:hypothetical protein